MVVFINWSLLYRGQKKRWGSDVEAVIIIDLIIGCSEILAVIGPVNWLQINHVCFLGASDTREC